jgi:hypothetical protein
MTLRNCNLVNWKGPAGSIIEDCNTAINEYDLDDFQETITVDSVVVHTRQFKKNRLHGRYNPDTESYEYHGSPIDVPE